jgi:hypothetical protein
MPEQPLFSYDLTRRHILCWKCPLCSFACQSPWSVRNHLIYKHHLPEPEAASLRDRQTPTYRDLPPKRHYVLSLQHLNTIIARNKTESKPVRIGIRTSYSGLDDMAAPSSCPDNTRMIPCHNPEHALIIPSCSPSSTTKEQGLSMAKSLCGSSHCPRLTGNQCLHCDRETWLLCYAWCLRQARMNKHRGAHNGRPPTQSAGALAQTPSH